MGLRPAEPLQAAFLCQKNNSVESRSTIPCPGFLFVLDAYECVLCSTYVCCLLPTCRPFVKLQACTEMSMPMSTDGISDMFWLSEWDPDAQAEQCMEQFGAYPRHGWGAAEYGGYDTWSQGGRHPFAAVFYLLLLF